MKNRHQSWEEEHTEIKRHSSKLQPLDVPKQGFFQVVPDDTPPTSKLKNNSFGEFLVPEEHLSLKLFFDNFRNYGTCGVFAAFGSWIWLNSETLLSIHAPVWISISVATTIWMLVAILLILNCIQTWRLSRELYFAIRAIRNAKTFVLGGGQSIFQLTIGLALLLIGWITDAALSLLIPLFSAAIVVVSVGLVGYTVLHAMR